MLANEVSLISFESPSVRQLNRLQHIVLAGLLFRCSRLMNSVALISRNGEFGETTAILDRCIFESSIKVVWLCRSGTYDKFVRFMANGLKADVCLKNEIEKEIKSRGGAVLEIENRMLKSIENFLEISNLSEEDVRDCKCLPRFDIMMREIGESDLGYIVGQKINSHFVHGTWSGMLHHCLKVGDDGLLHVGRSRCQTHFSQYLGTALQVVVAVYAYCEWMFDQSTAKVFKDALQFVYDEVLKVEQSAMGRDFDEVNGT
ncbi:MAG: DUF5677 domain-containing protein [Candidatus Delongbacteria bacterium]